MIRPSREKFSFAQSRTERRQIENSSLVSYTMETPTEEELWTNSPHIKRLFHIAVQSLKTYKKRYRWSKLYDTSCKESKLNKEIPVDEVMLKEFYENSSRSKVDLVRWKRKAKPTRSSLKKIRNVQSKATLSRQNNLESLPKNIVEGTAETKEKDVQISEHGISSQDTIIFVPRSPSRNSKKGQEQNGQIDSEDIFRKKNTTDHSNFHSKEFSSDILRLNEIQCIALQTDSDEEIFPKIDKQQSIPNADLNTFSANSSRKQYLNILDTETTDSSARDRQDVQESGHGISSEETIILKPRYELSRHVLKDPQPLEDEILQTNSDSEDEIFPTMYYQRCNQKSVSTQHSSISSSQSINLNAKVVNSTIEQRNHDQLIKKNETTYVNMSKAYISFQLPKMGFPNVSGNTCWMNASLQIILRLKFLVTDIIRCCYLSKNTILSSFMEIVKCCMQGSPEKLSVCLSNFQLSLVKWKKEFHTQNQQDASEFVTLFLSFLHTCQEEENDLQFLQHLKNNVEMTLQKRITCTICKYKGRITYETTNTFIMHVDSKPGFSVKNGFDQAMKLVQIPYHCNICKGENADVKQYFMKLPKYFIVQIVRSYTESRPHTLQRVEVNLTTHLNFDQWIKTPTRTSPLLNDVANDAANPGTESLKAAVTGTNTNAFNYQLTGILNHYGQDATQGHYTADVFEESERIWLHFDDLTVSTKYQVSDATGNAVMLFYTRL